MKRVGILISGSGTNMEALIRDMMADHPARPVVVVSDTPKAKGLGKAAATGIPTVIADHASFDGDRVAFEAKIMRALDQAQVDVICCAGFMRILSPDFVAHYAGRILNIHPSLLPKYRGLHTHDRALEAGESHHGCTVHEVTAELDAGPILGQATVPVDPEDTPQSLAARVQAAEHILYPAVLRRFVNGEKAPLFL